MISINIVAIASNVKRKRTNRSGRFPGIFFASANGGLKGTAPRKRRNNRNFVDNKTDMADNEYVEI